jgi:hypothetical protein
VRDGGLSGAERAAEIRKTRGEILSTLKSQTTVPSRGAVILPIAIYK